jgi:DUF1680 family protein
MEPRYISPHPYTNQDIIALARGPLVYCLEDVDNPWVDDHFKALLLDPVGAVEETHVSAEEMVEPYIRLTVQNGISFLSVDDKLLPHIPAGSISQKPKDEVEKLVFIPYALRDNRGGRGMMRVGIHKKH